MKISNTKFGLIIAETWRKLRLPIISLFIFFHTAALLLWNCPPFPLYENLVPFIRPYICYFGFWNQWKMFSHPKHWNIYLTANVTNADGSIVRWDFPRMEKLDYYTRAQKEPYRKWAHEYINEEEYKFVRPDACRFIARQMQTAVIKPVKVQLLRHWSWIQTPAGFGDPVSVDELEYAFFYYDVKPEDLQ